jgi:hypothetical protein
MRDTFTTTVVSVQCLKNWCLQNNRFMVAYLKKQTKPYSKTDISIKGLPVCSKCGCNLQDKILEEIDRLC